jgi:hypothetical protein
LISAAQIVHIGFFAARIKRFLLDFSVDDWWVDVDVDEENQDQSV